MEQDDMKQGNHDANIRHSRKSGNPEDPQKTSGFRVKPGMTGIIFLQSGESPEFGAFIEGEKKILPHKTAETLISRGVAAMATKEDNQ